MRRTLHLARRGPRTRRASRLTVSGIFVALAACTTDAGATLLPYPGETFELEASTREGLGIRPSPLIVSFGEVVDGRVEATIGHEQQSTDVVFEVRDGVLRATTPVEITPYEPCLDRLGPLDPERLFWRFSRLEAALGTDDAGERSLRLDAAGEAESQNTQEVWPVDVRFVGAHDRRAPELQVLPNGDVSSPRPSLQADYRVVVPTEPLRVDGDLRLAWDGGAIALDPDRRAGASAPEWAPDGVMPLDAPSVPFGVPLHVEADGPVTDLAGNPLATTTVMLTGPEQLVDGTFESMAPMVPELPDSAGGAVRDASFGVPPVDGARSFVLTAPWRHAFALARDGRPGERLVFRYRMDVSASWDLDDLATPFTVLEPGEPPRRLSADASGAVREHSVALTPGATQVVLQLGVWAVFDSALRSCDRFWSEGGGGRVLTGHVNLVVDDVRVE